MTGIVKLGESQVAQTLPEVEFALVLSRTIDALNEDPSLLRSTVYELARVTLRKDLFDGDPEQAQRMSQALETAIRGVEDFEIRQEGGAGRGGSIAGPMNRLSATAGLVAPTLPGGEFDSPVQRRSAALTQIDHPAFDTSAGERTSVNLLSRRGSTVRIFLFALATAIGVLIAGLTIADRTRKTPPAGNPVTTTNPAVASPTSPPGPAEPASIPPAPVLSSTVTAPPPPPLGLPLPASYGNYAINNGQLVELELLDGQVPDKRVAVSSPIRTASRITLTDGSPTFVVFRRDLASIPTDGIEARVVAKIRHTMKFDSQSMQPVYTPEEIWSIRPFNYRFRSSPVPGNPEMMLIKPDGITLPAGRYVLVLKRQGYDFTVAGKITDPNQCLERTEAANGSFYSACSKVP